MATRRPASPSKSSPRRRRVLNSTSTSSPSSLRRADSWQTDDDEDADEDGLLVDRRKAARVATGDSRGRRRSALAPRDGQSSNGLMQVVRLVRPVLRAVLLPILPYVLLALATWIGIALLRSYIASYVAALPAAFAAPLGRILAQVPNPRILVPSSRQVYSLVAFPSAFFGSLRGGRSPSFELLSASAAQSANERAHHALDVFDNLLRLSSPEGSSSLALEPVAIWELSAAVKYSSALDDRDFLADQLAQLGDLSRGVKDDIISLNAQGLNAFSFILNDFARLETLLSSVSTANKRVSAKDRADFERLLEILFDRISDSLGSLLISLDKAIPTATLATDSAHRIFKSFEREKSAKTNEWEDLPWPSRLLDAAGSGSKKARLLRKDVELTEASAFAVRNVWKGLDKTRDALKSYQSNVGFYKAGLVGSHLAAHGLSLENEVEGLKGVMAQMRNALDQAKQLGGGGSNGRPRSQTLPSAPVKA
ncbi:hypothetical protein JCM10908_005546 [Rhodotorula pacifica]|uniref:uncharacterized protein n=1 Tax=Rhodotorula pacifica TaxID=1495444 RepID=UPI00317B99A5